jgi:methyl-accepting chemotaxis protein
LHGVAQSTRAMMELPLAKERLISDWYRMVFAGIRRTTAVAKSADPALATFFAEDAKSLHRVRAGPDQENRGAGQRSATRR